MKSGGVATILSSKYIKTIFKVLNIKHSKLVKLLVKDRKNPPKKLFKDLHVDQKSIHDHNLFILYKGTGNNKAILYLHGGGYKYSFFKVHWEFIKKLIEGCDVDVYAPDYPILPSTYLDTHNMISTIYHEMLLKYDSTNITIMGDSAGGGLALAFCMSLRDRKIPLPSRNIMISPWLDVSLHNEEIKLYDKLDPWLNYNSFEDVKEKYAMGNPQNPLVSPLYGDVKKLNEMHVFFGTHDILYPDGKRFLKLCEESGVPLKMYVKKEMLHVYPLLPIKEAEEAFREICFIINQENSI